MSVALVTGGASGIGAALCRRLAARGDRVIVSDLNLEGAQALAEELGGRAVRLDVTDAEAFASVAREVVETEGRLDLLFNNAGIGLAGQVRDLEAKHWRSIVEVNLFGVINGIDAVFPIMRAQGSGHIVNTASGAGLCPRPGMTPYAAAKHAVVGLTTSFREEAALHGVRASVFCPGFIDTNIQAASHFVRVDGPGLTANIPLKPMTADECARIALRGVARNRVIIPVSKYVWLDWLLYRLSPALSIRISRLRARQFEKHRIAE